MVCFGCFICLLTTSVQTRMGKIYLKKNNYHYKNLKKIVVRIFKGKINKDLPSGLQWNFNNFNLTTS